MNTKLIYEGNNSLGNTNYPPTKKQIEFLKNCGYKKFPKTMGEAGVKIRHEIANMREVQAWSSGYLDEDLFDCIPWDGFDFNF